MDEFVEKTDVLKKNMDEIAPVSYTHLDVYKRQVVTDKWILCPVCGAKTRTQILDDTELKHFPLFCPKCKENFIIFVKCKSNIYCSI